ncbi:MAG: NAD(P)/FAD-dependent oxidoreductase [Mycobacteriales bacterium]
MYDLTVIGAGPAGCAAALRMLQLEPRARVLVVDSAAFPRDKVCGDAVSAEAVALLAELGVSQVTGGYRPVERLRLRSPAGLEALGDLPGAAFVVPRAVFDARLVAAVVARGAELRVHRVRRVEPRTGYVRVDGGAADARVVIGADGANSVTSRALGAPARRMAVAIRGYAPTGAAARELLIAVQKQHSPAYAWSFPIGDGWSNIGFGVFDDRLAGGRRALVQRLRAALPEQLADPATVRGHRLPLSTGRPKLPDGRVLLAGDAAGLINPLSGEGIHHALLSGARAGEAALDGQQAGHRYRTMMRRQLRWHLAQSAVLARCATSPNVVDAVIGAARQPDIFASITELSLGSGTIKVGTLSALIGRSAASRAAAVRRVLLNPRLSERTQG